MSSLMSSTSVLTLFVLAVLPLLQNDACSASDVPSAMPHPNKHNVTRSLLSGQLPADIVWTDVFDSSDPESKYSCFRIPVLQFTSKGTLLAFAEGRVNTCRDAGDVGDGVIVMRRSWDFGLTWTAITVVHSEYPKAAIGNPAPIEDSKAGKIFLLFTRDMEYILVLESSNDGHTWGNLRDITAMVALPTWTIIAPGSPGGIQLPSGRLIIGAYALLAGSFAIYSDNGGETWVQSRPIGDTSTKECQIAPLGVDDDTASVKQLVMTVRTPLGHMLAYSNNSGEDWYNLTMPKSLNPQTDCASPILAVPHEGVYLDTHLYTTQPHAAFRNNLTLFHSVDGGKTWKDDFVLWEGPSGYSSLAYRNLQVYCLYENGNTNYYEKVTLAIFSPLIVN